MQTYKTVPVIFLYLVKYCKDMKCNMLSLTEILSDNWKTSSNKNDVIMNMDWQIKTCNGWVCGMKTFPVKIIFAVLLTSGKCKHM